VFDMDVDYIHQISIEDYNRLRVAVGWNAYKPEKVGIALKRSDFITVAQIENQTIGMARVIQDGLQALVMDVIVLPEYQNRGIGKELMKQVMDYLDNISREGGLFVNLMSAQNREGFYERYGFEKRPNERRGSGKTQWIEAKEEAK